jgi:hypothetical protein
MRNSERSLAEVESVGVLASRGLIAGGAIAHRRNRHRAALVNQADRRGPAADYLATAGPGCVGRQQLDLVALAFFAGLGAVLYRVASR